MAHIHIVANVPGFLPENDTYCVDSHEDAAKAVMAEVVNLGLDTAEGCDRDGCNICAWCRKSNAILHAVQGETLRRVTALELKMFGSSSWNFDVPCSPGYVVEAVVLDSDRTACDYHS